MDSILAFVSTFASKIFLARGHTLRACPEAAKNFGTAWRVFGKWNRAMPDGDFKLCPYCKERIRASAIKCRYCGEWLEKPIKSPLQGRIESPIVPNQPGKADQVGESQIKAPTSSQLNQQVQSANQVDLPLPPNPAVAAPQSGSLMTKGKPGGKASNYFVCHWRGDLSLGVSFWVNCLLFNVAFSVAFSVLVQIGVIFNPLSVAPITAFIFLLFVGLSCWQIVGTWRCSQKYTNRGGTRAFALLAKIMMVVWVGASLRSVATDWVPLAKAFQRAIAFNKALPTCNVRVLPGGKAVEITGGLSIGSADKLEAALNATPQATVVHVNSIGGLMSEGQKAWHLVRQRGLSTYTDGCASAATLIFLSGKERTIGEGAKIGFHAGAGFGFWDGENNFYNNMAREIMTASGVSEDFINRALATPNSEIWNPSVEEMRRAKVITKEYAPLKTFTSSVLALIENPTNSGVFVPEKTGNEEIDQLIRFFTDSIARWKDLFNEMTSNLQKVGELEIYSEQTLMEKTKLQKGVAVQLRRQEIIEGYRSRAKLEVERVNHDLAAMNLSDPDAKSMLKGMSNSFEKGLLQAEDLFTFRLKVESDKKRFLEFMAQKFFRYKIDANKIRFEDQADSDEYEALTKTISESTKALDDFQDKMLKSTESTKQQLKEATQ